MGQVHTKYPSSYWLDPYNNSMSNPIWANATNVYNNDETYASLDGLLPVNGYSYWFNLTHFGFDLGSAVGVGGIIAKITYNTGSVDKPLIIIAQLIKNGVRDPSTHKDVIFNGAGPDDSEIILGDLSSIWGSSWLGASDVNSPGFGIAFAVHRPIPTANQIMNIRSVELTISDYIVVTGEINGRLEHRLDNPMSIKELTELTFEYDSIFDIFDSQHVYGHFLSPIYCPPIEAPPIYVDPSLNLRKLLNLKSNPYTLSKFRDYGFNAYTTPGRLIPTDSYYNDAEGTNVTYQGAKAFPHSYEYRGYGWIPWESIDATHAVVVQPYTLLTINYYHSAANHNKSFIIIHSKTKTYSRYQRSSSNIMAQPTVNYKDGSFEYKDTSLYEHSIMGPAVEFPMIYHNWTNHPELIYINSITDYIQLRQNKNFDDITWDCIRDVEYNYHSSQVWHYVTGYSSPYIIQGQTYTLWIKGGNNITDNNSTGLTFRLSYHIDGEHQSSYITMYDSSNVGHTILNHNSDKTSTLTFTVPNNATGVYLQFGAAVQQTKNIFGVYSYTGLKYKFKIY